MPLLEPGSLEMVEMGGGFWCDLTRAVSCAKLVFPHKWVRTRPFLSTDTPSYPIAFGYDRGVSDRRESTVCKGKHADEQRNLRA